MVVFEPLNVSEALIQNPAFRVSGWAEQGVCLWVLPVFPFLPKLAENFRSCEGRSPIRATFCPFFWRAEPGPLNFSLGFGPLSGQIFLRPFVAREFCGERLFLELFRPCATVYWRTVISRTFFALAEQAIFGLFNKHENDGAADKILDHLRGRIFDVEAAVTEFRPSRALDF